jgi:hypothetical protein
MKTCYRYEGGTFIDAKSLLDLTTDSLDSALARAGYFLQLQMPENSVAAIYQHVNGNNGVPYFLIPLWGESSEIAMLVADDLNQLLATLAAIEPLTRYSTNFRE